VQFTPLDTRRGHNQVQLVDSEKNTSSRCTYRIACVSRGFKELFGRDGTVCARSAIIICFYYIEGAPKLCSFPNSDVKVPYLERNFFNEKILGCYDWPNYVTRSFPFLSLPNLFFYSIGCMKYSPPHAHTPIIDQKLQHGGFRSQILGLS
jgi:hypothetical protein